MERIKNLNQYQNGFLIVMIAMILVFTVVYAMTISRVGFEYSNTILVPRQENGNVVYSGVIKEQKSQFTVSEDKTVVFQYGDKTYGPYTAVEDPTAIPKDVQERTKKYMTGVELRKGEEILFRGAIYESGDNQYLYNENGNFVLAEIAGIQWDDMGNAVNPMEPSALTILKLMNEPELTHKGDWFVWFLAVCLCLINALTILFADELFRFNLAFQIRNVDNAEPSDWEIISRYIGWIILAIVALSILIVGLE